MTVRDAAESGDRRAILEALRANLAARLDDPEERAAAALARELRMVLAELAEGPAEEADFVDELRARRAKAAGGKRSAGG